MNTNPGDSEPLFATIRLSNGEVVPFDKPGGAYVTATYVLKDVGGWVEGKRDEDSP